MPVKLRKSRSGNVTKSNNRPVSKQSRNRKTPKGKGKTKGKRTRRRVKRGGADAEENSTRLTDEKKIEIILETINKYYRAENDPNYSEGEIKTVLNEILLKEPISEYFLTLSPRAQITSTDADNISKKKFQAALAYFSHDIKKILPQSQQEKFQEIKDYITEGYGYNINVNSPEFKKAVEVYYGVFLERYKIAVSPRH